MFPRRVLFAASSCCLSSAGRPCLRLVLDVLFGRPSCPKPNADERLCGNGLRDDASKAITEGPGKAASLDSIHRLQRQWGLTEAAWSEGRWFRHCAVVGSSSKLLNARQGALIDAHDAVFRFNLAPTRGFEASVGAKETIRIGGSEDLLKVDRHAAERVALFLISRRRQCQTRMSRRANHTNAPQGRYSSYIVLECVRDVIREFRLSGASLATDECARMLRRTASTTCLPIPSSGLAGVVLAHEVCGNVSLFGFDSYAEHLEMVRRVTRRNATRDGAPVGYHYWDMEFIPGEVMRRKMAKQQATKRGTLTKIDMLGNLVINSFHDFGFEACLRQVYLSSKSRSKAMSS